jgi:hypothetical protein
VLSPADDFCCQPFLKGHDSSPSPPVCSLEIIKEEFFFCEPLKDTTEASDSMAMVNDFLDSNNLLWDLVEVVCLMVLWPCQGRIQDSWLS